MFCESPMIPEAPAWIHRDAAGVRPEGAVWRAPDQRQALATRWRNSPTGRCAAGDLNLGSSSWSSKRKLLNRVSGGALNGEPK